MLNILHIESAGQSVEMHRPANSIDSFIARGGGGGEREREPKSSNYVDPVSTSTVGI